jgi:hypothetical protein
MEQGANMMTASAVYVAVRQVHFRYVVEYHEMLFCKTTVLRSCLF